jgi:hypothetical protein
MGGTTQTVDKNQVANSLVNSSGSTSGATAGATSASGATNPWAPAQPFLSGILAQLQGQLANASLTPQESAALSGLASSSNYIGQFLPQATDLANTLLSGGNAQAQAPLIGGAYQQYQAQLNPYLQASFLDPRQTPGFSDALAAANADITNQVNGMFAGAGRDLSGLNTQALARGLSQGKGQLVANQYNANVANQLGAMGSLYGAGNTTAGLLSSLNQQALANRQAGLGVASTGQSFANMPYAQQLAAAAQARAIPLQTLQTLVSMGVPIAGVGSSFANTGATSGTTSGTQTGTQIGNTTGSSTQTTATPFNPWSLAPLAFLPMTGGGSLGGGILGSFGGGLFGSLSNGFMGPGSFSRS